MISLSWFNRPHSTAASRPNSSEKSVIDGIATNSKFHKKVFSLIFAGSSIVVIGTVAFTSYWIVRNLTLNTLKENALLKVEQSGREIDTWVASRLSEVEAIANSSSVRSMNWKKAQPFLQLEQDRLADYWMFILINPDGSYYTTQVGFAQGKNVSDRPYFQRAMQGKSEASDLIISRTTGKRQINISVPIWSFPPAHSGRISEDQMARRRESLEFYNFPTNPKQRPSVIGNLAGNIAISHVSQVVANTELGEGSYAFALDSQGVPIAHPNPDYLQGVNSFLDSPNVALAAIARSMVNRQQGVRLIQLDGEWVYVAYVPLEEANWSVALVIPRNNLEQQLGALNLLASVVGGLLLIAILVALQQIKQFERTREKAIQEALLNKQLAQTSTQLQDALAYLGTIIDNLVDGLLVTDMKGRITRCNPALSEMFGLGKLDLHLKPVTFNVDLQELVTRIQQQPGQIFTAEILLTNGRIGKAVATAILKASLEDVEGKTLIHPNESANSEHQLSSDEIDASEIDASIALGETHSSSPLLLPSSLLGSIILIRDITAEKEVDQMKTDFISTVSHELRTPLTSVLGFAKIIQKKLNEVVFPAIISDDKKIQRTVRQVGENIDIIVSEGLRLTALINDVLDIAKMEAGKVEWKMEPLNITEVIERAIAATTALFQAKNLQLIEAIEPELPEVIGDRDRLIQVMINLISNAIKFTDEGSITCQAAYTNGSVVVRIIDTGSGIAVCDQPKVFEKFKQVGDTLTDKPTGTGLGLPICKQIVEHHNGAIWVESELGKGSTFSFTLPASKQEEVRKIDFRTLVQQLQARTAPI
jgi:signal transduction histidine kinase